MSTETPKCTFCFPDSEGHQARCPNSAANQKAQLELVTSENARLREELAETKAVADQAVGTLDDRLADLRTAKTNAYEMFMSCGEARQRAEQAEARALAAEKERDEIAGLNQDQFLQLEYLRPVFEAAHALYMESEEYDFDDGLGRGAQQQFWDALASSFEPATEAIYAAIAGAKHG